jgi:succinate dehydrogenase / fumarate reductase, membrane anchor subunit
MEQDPKFLRSYAKGRKSGAPSWMWQRITGLALVILTVGHYIWMHYTPESGHTFNTTADRLANPVFRGMYIGFITIGMYHGVQGCWNVIRDFKLRPWITYSLIGALVIAALIFLGIGYNTVLAFDPTKP